MIAGPPDGDSPFPAAIAAIAGGDPVRPVWRNELGGLTFEIGTAQGRRFAKWAPAGVGLDLMAEAVRLRWAAAYTAVPRVLLTGADSAGAWLVTAALPGASAVAPRWVGDPRTAATAIGTCCRPMACPPTPHASRTTACCGTSARNRMRAATRRSLPTAHRSVPSAAAPAPRQPRHSRRPRCVAVPGGRPPRLRAG